MPRYSGPALAAGAISKAIGDMFEGMLAGQRGGVDLAGKIGEQGLAEREMALKGAAFPAEMDLSRAQAALARAGAVKTQQEAARIPQITAAEVPHLQAQTSQLGAQTDVLGWQARALERKHQLDSLAIQDWAQFQDRAVKEKRAVDFEDILQWTRRHPHLLQGPNAIPAAALMDLTTLEAYLKLLAAQTPSDPYKGPQYMLDVDKQAAAQAKDFVAQRYGEQSEKSEAADAYTWLTVANRNRLLLNSGLPGAKDYVRPAGPAPRELHETLARELLLTIPGVGYDNARAMAASILVRIGVGATTWQDEMMRMRAMSEGSTTPAPSGSKPAGSPKGGYGPPGAGPGTVYDEQTGGVE